MNYPKIHTHASGEAGILVNAYLIESENGVVAVDGTLIKSESKALRAKLDELKKPLLAVLVTHAHPDHIAGITEMTRTFTVPIIAVPSIDRIMKATEAIKHKQWQPIFQDEWIKEWTYPNQFVQDREMVTFDGINYQVYDIGAGGDCDANSVWVMEGKELKVAFVGDLVFSATHTYMADGSILAWLTNLQNAKGYLNDVSTLYPGHGSEGTKEMLEKQIEYLLTYCSYVRELSEGHPELSSTAKQELVARMNEYLPNAPLQFFIELSADAVAREIVKNIK